MGAARVDSATDGEAKGGTAQFGREPDGIGEGGEQGEGDLARRLGGVPEPAAGMAPRAAPPPADPPVALPAAGYSTMPMATTRWAISTRDGTLPTMARPARPFVACRAEDYTDRMRQ